MIKKGDKITEISKFNNNYEAVDPPNIGLDKMRGKDDRAHVSPCVRLLLNIDLTN